MMNSTCLIITNGEPLGLSLMRVARIALGQDVQVYSMTYAESIVLLTPQRVKETDFFILELFREYPGGRRAEGITLAERWMYRKPFLVVSPMHVAEKILCPGYWDVGANDSLADRVNYIFNFPQQCSDGFERMKEYFSLLLELPPQH